MTSFISLSKHLPTNGLSARLTSHYTALAKMGHLTFERKLQPQQKKMVKKPYNKTLMNTSDKSTFIQEKKCISGVNGFQ